MGRAIITPIEVIRTDAICVKCGVGHLRRTYR